jgi:hypothetical protein
MIILMNGIELETIRFQHAFARMCPDRELQLHLARVRRKEQHQATMVNAAGVASSMPPLSRS